MVPEAAPKLEMWIPGIHRVPILSLPEERSQRADFERLHCFRNTSLRPTTHLVRVPGDAEGGPAPGEVKLSAAGAAPKTGFGRQSRERRMDRRTGGALPSAGGWAPLPCQETCAAAELNEELPFAEPVGLDHVTEGLVRVTARVVGDARGPQLHEARLTPVTIPAGAFTAQAALITPTQVWQV